MRTFEDIKADITSKKDELLPNLSSTSATAIWNLWANLSATAILTFETIFYKERDKLIGEIENRRYGSLIWLSNQCKAFQLGDALVFGSDGSIGYASIDEDKQIVKQVAITENNDGSLLIKVAKDNNGTLEPLDPLTQLIHFTNYVQQIKIAGTVITTLSLNADLINGTAEIFYDGNYTEDTIKQSLETTLTNYQNNLGFDGVLVKNDLIDTIRETEGIDDVVFNTLSVTLSGESTTNIGRAYTTKSGYFNYQSDWLNNWTFTPRYA